MKPTTSLYEQSRRKSRRPGKLDIVTHQLEVLGHNRQDEMDGTAVIVASLANCLAILRISLPLLAHTANKWAETGKLVETAAKKFGSRELTKSAKFSFYSSNLIK